MNVVNLTPHEINVYGMETVPQWTYPPSGTVARATETREELPTLIPGMPVYRMSFGGVENLPEPQEGTIYLVSGLVLSRCAGRDDVFAPGEAVRDDKGRVIGCIGLSAAPVAIPWTDEQIETLVDADYSAALSDGHGGWVTRALHGDEKTPLGMAILNWAERTTPTVEPGQFGIADERVEIEVRRYVWWTLCIVIVRVDREWREFSLKPKTDINAFTAEIRAAAEELLAKVQPSAIVE